MIDRRDARLLVVDDVADNRDLLARRLQRLGYHAIVTAQDGVEALERLAAQDFDAVLLDVMMPRLSGLEVLERMRAENRLEDTPVIMISAATEIDTVVRCIELGAEDYLPKPFNPVLLRARLATVLDKKAMRAEIRRQLALLESDLAEARTQQLSMVPTEFPGAATGHRVEVAAEMHPARQVGGDLYDCFEAADDVLCIAVGDVSGKGMPAALFMARARSLLRAATLQSVAMTGCVPAPADVMAVLNAELCKNNPGCMFITLFVGFVNLVTGHVAIGNAGHVWPILVHPGGAAEEVPCPIGPPLGVTARAAYPAGELVLPRGATLVVITDGLPEMMDAAGDFYTLERVIADAAAAGDKAPAALTAHMVAQVFAFAAGAEQADDVTILALRLP